MSTRFCRKTQASQVVPMVKNPPANAGDSGSIPGSGRSGEGHGNPLQYSSWRIPWSEEPGGLQSMGSQRVGHSWGDLAHKQEAHGLYHFYYVCGRGSGGAISLCPQQPEEPSRWGSWKGFVSSLFTSQTPHGAWVTHEDSLEIPILLADHMHTLRFATIAAVLKTKENNSAIFRSKKSVCT